MPKPYLAYVRVSTTRQGVQGSSLAEQKSAIEAYAARHGLEVVEWFVEMDTAAKRGRRTFARMFSALKRGAAPGVIMHKIDRGARNGHDWADMGDLIDAGVDVRFVSDDFDLRTRGGRLAADMQAVIAADYIRNLREEVKKGIWGRLKQGIYPFRAPVGYLDAGAGKPKTVDPIRGPLVRLLFERYATNTLGLDALRHDIHARGLVSPNGSPLSRTEISRILNNPFYIGIIRHRPTGDTFRGAHEPLISEALYERVQAVLRGKTVPKAKKHRFLLRQLVKCARCGRRTLTGERIKGHLYYRCHTTACKGTGVRGDALENVIAARLCSLRLTKDEILDLGTLVGDEVRNWGEEKGEHIAALNLKIGRLDARLERLTDLFIADALDATEFKRQKEKALTARQALVDAVADANRRAPIEAVFEKFERQNTKLLQYETLVDDEKRELIETLCSNLSIEEKTAAIALQSPYREIEEGTKLAECGHYAADLRTKNMFAILMEFASEHSSTMEASALEDLQQRSLRSHVHSAH